jgi:LacI family transcriptional regulator
MPKSGKISQTRLARELGISQALVSLVLNGRRQGINPETHDRIWQHAVKSGYHPKGMRLASTPAAAKPLSVGFILRAPMRLNTIGSYFGLVQQGLHAALQAEGVSTTFMGAEDDLTPARLSRHFYAGHALRGVVLLGEVTRPFLQRLRGHERRLVVVSARFPGLCHSVVGNEPQALHQLVQHLHALGHRRIGWIGGNLGLGRHEERLRAFQAALQQHDLPFSATYAVRLQQADRAEGAEAVHQLVRHRRRRDFPTAFICYNSLMAHGAARAFLREGWAVPGDVSLAGADTPRPDLTDPPRVTGAGSNPENLGAAAARLLLAATGEEGEALTDLLLPSRLVTGESTGPAA